jgi:hypothetical protein
MNLEPDSKRMFVKVQYVSNGRTLICCIFIGAEESVILREIAGAEEHPTTERRWYDRVKDSVEYVIRNLGTLAFVWDKFRGM